MKFRINESLSEPEKDYDKIRNEQHKKDRSNVISAYCAAANCKATDITKDNISDWALARACAYTNIDEEVVLDYLLNKESNLK